MLRITGDVAGLIEIAERTGSLHELRERLNYLNHWGEAHPCYINIDVFISRVNFDEETVDVGVRFMPNKIGPAPVTPPLDGTRFGGLNLYKIDSDRFNWSVDA